MDIENAIQVLSNVGKKMTEHDPVNHPSHYTEHPSGIECIEITRHMNFAIGNAVKYLWRHGRKLEHFVDVSGLGAIQDLEKAIWYINDEIKRLRSLKDENLAAEKNDQSA